jgi:Family of unknown function (DUF5832)
MTTNIDHLEEDKPIYGQNYVCLSFISPEGIKNTNIRALKIRGVFDKYEDALHHAKKLQESDPLFHVFVGEVGKWLPWDPAPDDETKVKESQYREPELQDLMTRYKEQQEKVKKVEADRRRELLEKSLLEAKKKQGKKEPDNRKEALRKKVEESKMNEVGKKVKKELDKKPELTEEELKEREEKFRLEKERIDKNEAEINDSEIKLRKINENLSRMKQIHEQMLKNTN